MYKFHIDAHEGVEGVSVGGPKRSHAGRIRTEAEG